MESIAGLDHAVFRLVNEGWVSPFLDWLMPFLSGNAFFRPALALLAAGLIWKGGRRGRCFLLVMVLTLALGEWGTGRLKKAFNRPRPFVTHPETRTLVGKGLNASMPSGHSAIWAAAAVVAAGYYRRSPRFLVPLAAGVGLSRMYVGVHYPSDVLAGWSWGALYGWALPRFFDGIWAFVGATWFPAWRRRLPSLLPAPGPDPFPESAATAPADGMESHWRRLTWLLSGALLAARLGYLAAGIIDLSEDEAYQWLWSKHPALSYYSKPPFIAYAQWIGTALFGDTELGVRFFSPVLSCLGAVLMARFCAAFAGWRAAFLLVAAANTVPLLAVGSVLMTIDPLTVAFWSVAMVSGWRAFRSESTLPWIGLGVGLAGTFLSKYFSPFLLASFAVYLVASRNARIPWRRPGPWIALGFQLLALVPVYLWNSRNHWITFTHLRERGGLDRSWSFHPNFVSDFLLAEFGLWNPFYFVAIVWAVVAFLRRWRSHALPEPRREAMLYCLALGLPVFLFYLGYTVRARVQPNWIATSILPLMTFAVLWWEHRHSLGDRVGRRLLAGGVALGLPLCVLLHETRLITRATGYTPPVKYDLIHRVRGYREAAALVESRRDELLREGRPVMVVADHYGWAGILNFYMPSSRNRGAADPVATVAESVNPSNQIWFWPEFKYRHRAGITVLFVGEPDRGAFDPEVFGRGFESHESLGILDVPHRGRVFHRLRLHVFRNQR